MAGEMISEVRRFNRIVTQRVGALNDRFLRRNRPMGESRLLWEIGVQGSDTRTLRTRLELDSGYLSRLLRSVERAGLVVTEPDPGDGRVRAVRLTPAGMAEREELDRLSDEFASSLLDRLSAPQRDQLIRAMREVSQLLTASRVQIEVVDPDQPGARACLDAYLAELDERFTGGFDPSRSVSAASEELRPPAGVMVIATLDGGPIGCGAVKYHPGAPSEIKRMWIAPTARGLGLGRTLLNALEQHAMRSHPVARLETNSALEAAVRLYRSSGYVEVPAFNDEPYAHHWFEKNLTRHINAR
jgi:DNA-binding MarR family transcriptional regulator/GNAT superfamily N-acetyltransferase